MVIGKEVGACDVDVNASNHTDVQDLNKDEFVQFILKDWQQISIFFLHYLHTQVLSQRACS